ncbi:MAG: peptide deformylase [Pseudomonadota bacterium]
MHRPFLLWPDRRLSETAVAVSEITNEILSIWEEMIRAMEAMPGVGLAAPQLGIPLRLAVVDASDARGQAVRLANPVVTWISDEVREHMEASPNLPGVSAKVTRPAAVTVRYMDAQGDEAERRFEGLWATSVQHQVDHLNGRVFIDRLSRTKRDILRRKAVKAR